MLHLPRTEFQHIEMYPSPKEVTEFSSLQAFKTVKKTEKNLHKLLGVFYSRSAMSLLEYVPRSAGTKFSHYLHTALWIRNGLKTWNVPCKGEKM